MLDPVSAGAAAQAATSAPSLSTSSLGKEEFLQLLVTQLSHQDPLNPMEGQEFAVQLAQFSSVEALLNIEEALKTGSELNGLLAQSVNSGVASGLIGKEVTVLTDRMSYSGEGPVDLAFDLGGTARSVTVTIRDEFGGLVRTLETGPQGSGRQTIEWDGKRDDGAPSLEGPYRFSVSADDGAGNAVPVQTYWQGRVERVSFSREGILVTAGGVSVTLSEVTSVEEG